MKTKKIFYSFVMAFLLIFSSVPYTAVAQEISFSADTGYVSVIDMSNFELLDDSVMTKDAAIQLLGLTAEEAEKATFYTCTLGSDSSNATNSQSIETLKSGEVKSYEFSFQNYNRGVDRKFNGNQMKWAATLLSTNGTMVSVTRCSYDKPSGYETMDLTPGSYSFQQTDWFDIYYGGTYYWKYYGYGGTSAKPATHKVRLAIAVF